MKLTHALGAGLVGAASLTVLHEITRRTVPDAPRLDELGMHLIARSLQKVNQPVPERKKLFTISMIGDLISNSLYYSLVGVGKDSNQVWLRGGVLGLLAGLGAVVLPSSMGLGEAPTNRTRVTQLLTIALYLVGGVVSAAAYRAIQQADQDALTDWSDFLGE